MDGSVVTALEVMLSGGDPLDVAQAAEAVIGFCHAVQLQSFNQVFQEAELAADPDGVVVDPTSPEVACAMGWSPGLASSMVDTAVDVVTGLPELLSALAAGRIDLGKVREITRGTCELRPADRQELAVGRSCSPPPTPAHSCGPGWAGRSTRIDPDAADRRRRAAHKRPRGCGYPRT
ncbi:MAG: DUF222 domain-containing protein [Candidatus Nanopelagicales bacterium]